MTRAAMGLLALLLLGPALASAQVAVPEASPVRPPVFSHPEHPEQAPKPNSVDPNYEAKTLRDRAQDLRLRASDLRGKADDLRDNNKDDIADTLDERAGALEDRARSLEYRADQVELSGGSYSGRVQIPDL